ncbi:MAG: AraC family transcriptional regulator [Prolixibacteraceae bacterium]
MNSNARSDIKTPQSDIPKNADFRKYLPISEADKSWGLVVHDVGSAVIPPKTEYPPKGHPGTHRFSWEQGRILQEYHFILITEGKGIFESRSSGTINLGAGDGIILFPGEWHRYKPIRKVGWTEHWVGFSGTIAEVIMKDNFFPAKQPVVKNCTNILVKSLFKSLFQLISEESFGYQRTASGICLQLAAEICNIQKGSELNMQRNSVISEVKYLMHKKIDEHIDFHQFCRNHMISYSKFRSDFRYQTSFAPLQYFMLMKIEKAKDLLMSTNMKTKEIAYHLGFKSDHYFSRLFRAKTGFSPQEFRTQRRSGL